MGGVALQGREEDMRAASIDIGSNTILMTIAEGVNPQNFRILDDVNSIARLGENVDKTSIINLNAVRRAELILSDYRTILDRYNPDKIIAVCTSAMRDAKNNLEIINRFQNIIKGDVLIIDGTTEANISFLGTVEDAAPSVVIDIGGGSTELIIGSNQEVNYRISTNLGAVRLTERFFSSLPPKQNEIDAFVNFVQLELNKVPLDDFNGKVYAVAGTATTLSAIDLNLKEYDRSSIHNHQLYFHKISTITDILLSSSVESIIFDYHVPARRADVLPAGSVILREIMRSMNASTLNISTFGLRYGVIKKILANEIL